MARVKVYEECSLEELGKEGLEAIGKPILIPATKTTGRVYSPSGGLLRENYIEAGRAGAGDLAGELSAVVYYEIEPTIPSGLHSIGNPYTVVVSLRKR